MKNIFHVCTSRLYPYQSQIETTSLMSNLYTQITDIDKGNYNTSKPRISGIFRKGDLYYHFCIKKQLQTTPKTFCGSFCVSLRKLNISAPNDRCCFLRIDNFDQHFFWIISLAFSDGIFRRILSFFGFVVLSRTTHVFLIHNTTSSFAHTDEK